jgi:ubiquinone/menaquinone biosynthesis C-methylase UbiE
MKRRALGVYRCPYTGERLELAGAPAGDAPVVSGELVSAGGRHYPVADGVPHLIHAADEVIGEEEKQENAYYQASYQGYDAVLDWVFKSFQEDESVVRGKMIDLLEVGPRSRVLETGAGTCRDSVHIARRLGPDGEFYVQDFSSRMLELGRQRMAAAGETRPGRCPVEFFVGNAAHLPFADGHFDAAFHFGGLNLFTDKKQAIAEMTRVVRVGGKVVFGDEGVAPWLRSTQHGEILLNSNKLYRYTPPTEALPECARDGCVRWLLGSAYWVIDFRVGEGPPALDLDLPIVGRRGGTHRSRFFGVLEGVTVEAKEMAVKAALASGLTIHEWLDRAVRAAAGAPAKAA